MEALFIILFISVVLLKHCGAVVRDNKFNQSFRENARRRGQVIYYAQDGPRYVNNNHKVKVHTDLYYGRIVTDLVTGKKYYLDLHQFLEDYHKLKDRKTYDDFGDDIWCGIINNGDAYGFVDRNTEEIYFLACASERHDANRNDGRGETWFYVDVTRKHMVKRTKKQLEKDAKYGQVYTDEEIENYVDIDSDYGHGCSVYREADGRWTPRNEER